MARPYDNTNDVLIVVLDQKQYIEQSTARVVKVRHGKQEQILGLNVVAAIDGLIHQTDCEYCSALRTRIDSRVLL